MMRTSLSRAILIGVACLLSGCAAVSEFTSEPSGASVSLNGRPIGTTPFSHEVKDIAGMNSTYGFTAEKAGYRPDTKTFSEKGFADAKDTIPPRIHFVLQPVAAEKPKQQPGEGVLPLTPHPKPIEPF